MTVADLTLRGFREWLRDFSEDEQVGVARSDCDCPLAQYIRHRLDLPAPLVSVMHDQVWVPVRGQATAYRLADWAVRFVDAVDDESFRRVVAAQALEVLDGVLGAWVDAPDPLALIVVS